MELAAASGLLGVLLQVGSMEDPSVDSELPACYDLGQFV